MSNWTFANFDFKAKNHRWWLKISRAPVSTDEGGPTAQVIIKSLVKNLRASVKICGSNLLRLKRRNSNV
jgi:hypothetical protein